MLYVLNLYSDVYQLFLSKTGKKTHSKNLLLIRQQGDKNGTIKNTHWKEETEKGKKSKEQMETKRKQTISKMVTLHQIIPITTLDVNSPNTPFKRQII